MADPVQTLPDIKTSEKAPVVVKKYANRRLYNTESSSYITLDNLAEMVRQGRDFVVYDAKSGDDITRGVLTQIIVEEEGKGQNAAANQLPAPTDRVLRRHHAGSGAEIFGARDVVLRPAAGPVAGGDAEDDGQFVSVRNIEEVSRQNMAMMERAINLFTPFYRGVESSSEEPPTNESTEIAALQAEVERLKSELAAKKK